MIIETKFAVGDLVYFIGNNFVIENSRVSQVKINKQWNTLPPDIKYILVDGTAREEKQLSDTKSGLIRILNND